MRKTPKLKVEGLGWDVTKQMCDFDQARYFPYESRDLVIVVEGKVVKSFKEMRELAEKDVFKDREHLEVKFLEVIVGG
ncbi:MAG: hypothetical protein ABII06_11125 [Pseudomonadota bacterium]